MIHVTAEFANTFCTQIKKKARGEEPSCDLAQYLVAFFKDTPADFDEIVAFRFDQMTSDEQMLLKIASVAGFDQYSFSQDLLESVLLSLSRREIYNSNENDDDFSDEWAPMCAGDGVPTSVGETNTFNHMFQGDKFEQTLGEPVFMCVFFCFFAIKCSNTHNFLRFPS